MAELTGIDLLECTGGNINQIFGERKSTEVLTTSIDWKLPEWTIEYIESSCTSCTKAWYEKGNIMVVLDLSKASNYVPGKTSVIKEALIWLNDGEPRFIPGDGKKKTLNPKKRFVRVRLTALVVV